MQVWHLAGDGLTGLIRLDAERAADVDRVRLRVLLGPEAIERRDEDDFVSGPLQVRALSAPGEVVIDRYQTPGDTSDWPSLEFVVTPEDAVIEAGGSITFALWVGPEHSNPPDSFRLLEKVAGWEATWPDGRRRAVIYNEGKDELEVADPFVASGDDQAAVWSSGARWKDSAERILLLDPGVAAFLTAAGKTSAGGPPDG